MRIDKFLSDMGLYTRRESAELVKKRRIKIDGVCPAKASEHFDPEKSELTVDGNTIAYKSFFYLMLNKPEGYVSATDDGNLPTVLELVDERYKRAGVFPCGRLDRNTTGLMLLTNDGKLSHKLLSPRCHVKKKYRFTCKFPISSEDEAMLEAGLEIEGGYRTLPCEVEMLGEKEGFITLTEGKYHQIKLMAKAVHNQITSLKRVSFGPLELDGELAPGEYRVLSEKEEELLRSHSAEEK